MLCAACASFNQPKNHSPDKENPLTRNTKRPEKSCTKKLLIGTGVTASVVTLSFVALPLLGFTSSGIAAGSLAAAWKASIGSSLATSKLFSTCQSLGTMVANVTGTTKVGMAAASGLAKGGYELIKYFSNSKKAEKNSKARAYKMDENPFEEIDKYNLKLLEKGCFSCTNCRQVTKLPS